MKTFKDFILTEDLKVLGKIKIPRSSKLDDPLKSFRFKMSRGMNRKNLNQVPDIHSHTRPSSDISQSIRSLGISNKVIGVAKTAFSGVWRISKPQVIDIARKYKFHVPNKTKPMKHLGSTGIQMIRLKPGVFYLYKPRRRKARKSATGSIKRIQGMTYPGL